jgi:hypothetical protein
MAIDETHPLRKLRAQYRQVVLRDEVREKILRTLAEPPEHGHRALRKAARPARSPGWRRTAWGTAALAFVAGALVAWGLRGRRPERLEAVVSTLSGQVFSDGVGTHLLAPRGRVFEGQRLRTSAAGRVETNVGPHIVTVSADSGLLLESLRPQDLRFRLERGSVSMTVAPLGPNGRLRVFAGGLSVEVVGTAFGVQREDDCSSVSVRSGRVRTSFLGKAGELRAGEERRFCGAAVPLPRGEPSRIEASVRSGGASRDASRRVAAQTPSLPAAQKPDEPYHPTGPGLAPPPPMPATQPPSSVPLSDEERLFRDASRGSGEASSRISRLREYLARFPNGTFAEDALFQLIRDSYAAANSPGVLDYASQFLRRCERGSRANEVRLLYVHSLIEMGLPLGQSLDLLETLLSGLDSLPRSQQEQATYLAVLAYCGAPRPPLCRDWADRYLQRYPHGLYAPEVRRTQLTPRNGP